LLTLGTLSFGCRKSTPFTNRLAMERSSGDILAQVFWCFVLHPVSRHELVAHGLVRASEALLFTGGTYGGDEGSINEECIFGTHTWFLWISDMWVDLETIFSTLECFCFGQGPRRPDNSASIGILRNNGHNHHGLLNSDLH
jgi:hypothetical protein